MTIAPELKSPAQRHETAEQSQLEGGGVYFWVRLFEQNIDEYYQSLVDAGVNIVEPIKDQFWGDRSFTIRDCNNYFVAFNQVIVNEG